MGEVELNCPALDIGKSKTCVIAQAPSGAERKSKESKRKSSKNKKRSIRKDRAFEDPRNVVC